MLINSTVLSSKATQDSSLNRVLLKRSVHDVFGPLYSFCSVNQTAVLGSQPTSLAFSSTQVKSFFQSRSEKASYLLLLKMN